MSDKMREEFEEWYATNAFDYAANPIGSRECGLQWTAWQAARTVPEGFVMVPVELLDRFPELNEFNYSHDDVCELNAWGVELVLSAAPEGEK